MIAAPKHRATRRTTLFALTAVKHHCVVHVAAATAAAVAAAADCAACSCAPCFGLNLCTRVLSVSLSSSCLGVCVCSQNAKHWHFGWACADYNKCTMRALRHLKKTGSKYESAGMECLNV